MLEASVLLLKGRVVTTTLPVKLGTMAGRGPGRMRWCIALGCTGDLLTVLWDDMPQAKGF